LNWAYALLGISTDADTTTIKRAYARLLRTTRPDEDAAAFQRLNTAYQLALAQAAHHPATRPEPPPPAPTIVVNLAIEPASTSMPPATAHPNSPSAPPAPMEILKPPTPPAPASAEHPVETLRPREKARPLAAPASLEVLKTSTPPTPPSPSAPVEVLKPAASAPKPVARPVEVLRPPEPKPIPSVHPKVLAERVIREAAQAEDSNKLSYWLNHSPEFWSLQVKQATGQLLLQLLLREPQPMAAASLDALLHFFDLDHVLSGVNPVALEQLRNKQALQWEMLHDHAAMARRLRILTPKGFPHTMRVRECINLLKQPLNWRQTVTTALTRGKPIHLARIVYALCNAQFTALPQVIDREHARFWFRAAGVSGFNRERLTVSAIRAVSIALACAAGITILTMLLSLQNGHIPSEGWQGGGMMFIASFGGILLAWLALNGASWLDQWQGLPETAELRKPWLHRLFIPALAALGLGLDYAAGLQVAASIVTWATMILALRRFTRRAPKRSKSPLTKLSPRMLTYLLIGGVFGISNVVNQVSAGMFDNVPVLGLAAGATLFIWGLDMWRHRAYLHPKFARR
jgi:hypothetical protein